MDKTFHIDGDFLQEDARMERPSYKDYDNGIDYNNAIIGYNAHIASLGRYILGDLKEWTKTTGITEDDFHPDCATMQKTACQVFKRPAPMLMTVTASLPPHFAEERTFTLAEMRECWDACIIFMNDWIKTKGGWKDEPTAPNKKQYFKATFNITLPE